MSDEGEDWFLCKIGMAWAILDYTRLVLIPMDRSHTSRSEELWSTSAMRH
jgi:hypothetical protein